MTNLERLMSDPFHRNAPPSLTTITATPASWAMVVFAGLLPFATAYVIAGVNSYVDGQFIAALVGLLILVTAVVVNVALAVVRKLHQKSNENWIYW